MSSSNSRAEKIRRRLRRNVKGTRKHQKSSGEPLAQTLLLMVGGANATDNERNAKARLLRTASGEIAHDDYFRFCDLLHIPPTPLPSPDDSADKIRQMFMVSGALRDLPAPSVVVPELAPDGALIVPTWWLLDQMISAETLPRKVLLTQPISLGVIKFISCFMRCPP